MPPRKPKPEKYDTRDGGPQAISPAFLGLLKRLHEKLASSALWSRVTGLELSDLTKWRKEKAKAARGKLAWLCECLNCRPADLELPPATADAVADFLRAAHGKPWQPSGPSVLEQHGISKGAAEARNVRAGLPPAVPEWVGRDDLLTALTEAWIKGSCRVFWLIGEAGEGKSALARRFIDQLDALPPESRPEGLVWHTFTRRTDVERFLREALLATGSTERDVETGGAAAAQAGALAERLEKRRYLFVLDGLEAILDESGRTTSLDLNFFLDRASLMPHCSFLLLTSQRAGAGFPSNSAVRTRELGRLTEVEGRFLLTALGVIGADDKLEEVVRRWDGHALALHLLGEFLKRRPDWHRDSAEAIPAPAAGETGRRRIDRLLPHYAELTEAHHAFLRVCAAFRKPVTAAAFGPVFRSHGAAESLNGPLLALDAAAFDRLVADLGEFGVLRRRADGSFDFSHPLIREYYRTQLEVDEQAPAARETHRLLLRYYRDAVAPPAPPAAPSLDDLEPYIDAVYHACRAGEYDEAWGIAWEDVAQQTRFVLTVELGAYHKALEAGRWFFPDGNDALEPQVASPVARCLILRTIGLCHRCLGTLREAEPFYRRARDGYLLLGDRRSASTLCQHRAELYLYLGRFHDSRQAAEQGRQLAEAEKDAHNLRAALGCLARLEHLRGDLEQADALFDAMEQVAPVHDPLRPWLWPLAAVWRAEHLLRRGRPDEARRLLLRVVRFARTHRFLDDESRSRRILGDAAARASKQAQAARHYDQAVHLADRIVNRSVLIEALTARGGWLAQVGDLGKARQDLERALSFARAGGYRTAEVDLYVALGRACLTADDRDGARRYAELALRKADEGDFSYLWGRKTAEELGRLA